MGTVHNALTAVSSNLPAETHEIIGFIKERGLKFAIERIPIFGKLYNEIEDYIDSKHLEKRIQAIEIELSRIGIIMDDFIKRLNLALYDEHKYYLIRNTARHIFLFAPPATVDILNKALIEIVMNDEYSMAEHATEIIKQLNPDDIAFLKAVKKYKTQKEDDRGGK